MRGTDSGDARNLYLLDVVKNRLGLRPLVVAYNSQFNSRVGIKNFDLIRETFDVDLMYYASNPIIYKRLIRESLTRLNSVHWPLKAGQNSFPVQVAVEQRIPLVIWPFHQPTEQVGMHSYTEEAEMTSYGFHNYDLIRLKHRQYLSSDSLVHETDLEDILYPSNKDLVKSKVRGIYLNNYLPWDTRRYSEQMIEKYGCFAAENKRTFDTYDRIDDMSYMTIHDVLKYANLGYSRVTDNLCREIRFKRISREDAVVIRDWYQQQYPEGEIRVFLEWLGMNERGFDWFLERSPFKRKIQAAVQLNERQRAFIESFVTNDEPVHSEESFIMYGKGLYV